MGSGSAPYVGYVRVSFVGRRKGDRFHSPDEQAAAIRGWAAAHQVDVEVLPAELNAKGSDAERPILNGALNDIEQGRYAGLVVAYLSRVARSAKHTLEIYERVEAAGGRVVAIAENIDTSTPDGRMTRTIHAAIAQAELERHTERFAALRLRTVERGVWKQRQVPLGYVKDPSTRRLVPSDRADLVRSLFERRAAGEDLSGLAREADMSTSGVRQLLANRVYLGELWSGESVNRSAHPALVSAAGWEAAQVTVRRPRSSREPALLAGLVRCGSCGRVCSRSTSAKARGGEIYICHSGSPCPAHASVNLLSLHEHVEPLVLRELRAVSARGAATSARFKGASAAVEVAEAELAAYLGAVSAVDVGAQAFAAGARARREAVDVAERARRAAGSVAAVPPDILGWWASDDASLAKKNVVLRGLLEAVVVWPSSRVKRVPVADRVQVLGFGAGVVHDFRSMPERRRPAMPIDRLDDTDERLVGAGG